MAVPLLAQCPRASEHPGRRDVGAVDLRVTIGAAVGEGLLYTGIRITRGMSGMALQTEKRHGGVKQIIVDGAMRRMTVGAVFGHIAMLEGERPLLLHMTSGACLLRGHPLQKLFLDGAVGIMAVGAGHLLFP